MLYIQWLLAMLYAVSKYPIKFVEKKITLDYWWKMIWYYPHLFMIHITQYILLIYGACDYWLGYTIYWWIWHIMIPITQKRWLVLSWMSASIVMPSKLSIMINGYWFIFVNQYMQAIVSFMYKHNILLYTWKSHALGWCILLLIWYIFIYSICRIIWNYCCAIVKHWNVFKKWSKKTGLHKVWNVFAKIISFITRKITVVILMMYHYVAPRVKQWWYSKGISHEKFLIHMNVCAKIVVLEKKNITHSENHILPSVKLLVEGKTQQAKWDQNARLEQLKVVLNDYNIHGQITGYNIGPVVTLYKLEPEPGMKESQIVGLGADIARSMSALSVRIASIPGHNLIGVEISNPVRQTVYLRELIEADEFQQSRGLALALGCDISGKPFIANLETAPHMLIAGTTGSGKSVSIHTLLLSLLYKHTPETCRLIMIDPKMLELAMYKDIPHLLVPVVTNPKLAVVALKWAIQEMETRYELMSHMQVRNITEYNQALINGKNTRELMQEDGNMKIEILEKMPYIVIIVDEFADLMLVAGKDIDESIQRLAQMARAAGIHLILATQRPSVDVITGTIKANFPTRLTFQLASKIDSRTILGDRGGADQLLGKGDMLYLNLNYLVRAHGPYVSNAEVEAVVDHWKRVYGKPAYKDIKLKDEEDNSVTKTNINNVTGQEEDKLFDQVVEYVYRTKRATASSIQREFNIGFNRAAGYLDKLEKAGKITAPDSMGRRKLIET